MKGNFRYEREKSKMKYLFLSYPKCTTCQKAKTWLTGHGVAYEERNIKIENPNTAELKEWYHKSKLPIKKFFNTSGLVYKALGLKDKLETLSEEELLALLSTDGMLVKRPIIIGDDIILVGFKEKDWEILK